jgi:hypothetical protein
MGPLQFAIHFASFAAPAALVALLLAIVGRVVVPDRPAARSIWLPAAINFVAGLGVLGAGLWFFGHDGKMATYAALVLVMGTSQWLASRAWR